MSTGFYEGLESKDLEELQAISEDLQRSLENCHADLAEFLKRRPSTDGMAQVREHTINEQHKGKFEPPVEAEQWYAYLDEQEAASSSQC